MHKVIYLDIFFLWNMYMDFILLRIVNRLMHGSAGFIRSLVGSLTGAALISVCVLLPVPYPFIRFLLAYAVINTLMIRFGCRIRGKRALCKAVGCLYISTFLLGGIMRLLYRYTQYTFMIVSSCSYILLTVGIKIYECMFFKKTYIYPVCLCVKDRKVQMNALYDTGNRLQDPFTGKGVSLIEEQVFLQLFKESYNTIIEQACPRYITYRSIGQEQGMLLMIRGDYMEIERESYNRKVLNPLIGIVKQPLSRNGSYRMILTPCLIDE